MSLIKIDIRLLVLDKSPLLKREISENVNMPQPPMKSARDASNIRPLEKNGVRPPQRGGFNLPKPLYQKAVNVLASRVRSQR